MFTDAAVVCITTYTMIAYSGRRSEDAEKASVFWHPVAPPEATLQASSGRSFRLRLLFRSFSLSCR
jgi:hypothetical protein